MNIRLATERDAAQILAIYEPIVRETAISFETDIPTLDEMRRRISDTLSYLPWLVCEQQGTILGYAYASKHRARAAYQWSADVSVYVHPQAHRQGVASALYASLFQILRLQGFYNLYAGIALPNAASVGLHESVGFKPVGVYKSVGYKLGSWHDVGHWHMQLQPMPARPTPTRSLRTLQESAALKAALHIGCTQLNSAPASSA